MAAPTNIYIDPLIAADSGAGTIGDPYGDLQYALDQVTRDSTNGDRFNIKSGTDEILTNSLDLTTYGTPSLGGPLIFQGYTSTAEDGGEGGISGNGTYSIINSATLDYICFADLHLHNCGSANIILLDDYIKIINCHIENTTGSGIIIDIRSEIINCRINKIGAYGIYTGSVNNIYGNYIKHDVNTMSYAIYSSSINVSICYNILSLSGSESGIYTSTRNIIINNSILSSNGTGTGIYNSNAPYVFEGNLIEGFSGVGGEGIDFASLQYTAVRYNACYNNTTNYVDESSRELVLSLVDNESLSSSPFSKSGSDTFDNRFIYFEPVNTGNVINGMPGNTDKGAIQASDSGGGLIPIYSSSALLKGEVMGRIVYQELKGLSVPADATVDVWNLIASSTQKVKLLGFELTSDATAAAIISVNLHRVTAAGSGGSASTTEELSNEEFSAITASVRTLDTTPGTDGGGLQAWQWEQLGPMGHVYTPEMAPISKVSEGFALTWNTATAATVSGYICWEEM